MNDNDRGGDRRDDGGTDLLARLARLDTTLVSDALDRLGLPGATTGLNAPRGGVRRTAGRAVTVEIEPRADDRPRPHLAAAAIERADGWTVLVIGGGGRTDVSSWGGLLGRAARRKGVRGVVVDGAYRDAAELEQLGLPVFARAVVPVSARGRLVERANGGPVRCAGAMVEEGDLVLADDNGVVFVGRAGAVRVVALAERLARMEAAMAAAVDGGASIVEVMHDARFDAQREG